MQSGEQTKHVQQEALNVIMTKFGFQFIKHKRGTENAKQNMDGGCAKGYEYLGDEL